MNRPAALKIAATALLLALPIAGSAQMAHRLKGFIRTAAGAPIASASIRADALSGLRGEPFAGQDARGLAPKGQRQALAAAIDDLRGISRVQ